MGEESRRMIVYDGKACLGMGVLCRLYGSAFPRALPYALVSTLFAWWIAQNRDENLHTSSENKVFYHPYAHQVFAITASFLLVFRSQLAYQRYWEGRTAIAAMQAKWSDSAAQAVLFSDTDGEPSQSLEMYRLRIIHLFSLLHAVAIQTLRRPVYDKDHDFGLDGLVESGAELAPPVVENREYRQEHYSTADTMRKVYLSQDKQQDLEDHQLEVIMGITEEEKEYLVGVKAERHEAGQVGKEPVDQVFRIYSWIMREAGRNQRDASAGFTVPPPVLSRLYQVLSDGHIAFMQAKKIAQTPFPLPYAQLVMFFLMILMTSSPVVIVAYVDSIWGACALSFCAIFASFSLNEVSRELEGPFGHDPNDLPMSELHYDFNVRLVSLLHMGMRQNGVNHVNPQYILEGTVREKFASTFGGSMTEKTLIKRGAKPTKEQELTLQGRSLSNLTESDLSGLEAEDARLNMAGMEVSEDLDIPEDAGFSPRVHQSSSIGIKLA